jgi:O-antigen/teichoic acid export membrane protein
VSLRQNIKSTLLTRIFLLTIGVVSSIIYARVLGPELLGQGVLLLIFPPILVKLIGLGFICSLSYLVGKFPEKKREFIGTANTFGVLLAVCSTGILVLGAPYLRDWYYSDSISLDLLIFALCLTPLHVASITFMITARALNKIKELNRYRDVHQALWRFAMVLLLLAYLDWGIWGYILMELILNLVLILSLGRILHQDKLLIFSWNQKRAATMLNYGLRGYMSGVSNKLSLKLDQLVAGALLTDAQVGIYTIALQLAARLMTIANVITFPLLPNVSRLSREKAGEVACRILDLLTIPMLLGITGSIIAAPFFLELAYGADYTSAFIPFALLATGTIFASWTAILGVYFAGTDRPEVKSLEKIGNLTLKAVLLYFLVSSMGIQGAALSQLVVEFIMFSALYWYFKRTAGLNGKRIFTLKISKLKHELKLLRQAKV